MVQRSGVSERQRAHVEAVRPAAFNWPRDTVSRVHSAAMPLTRREREPAKKRVGTRRWWPFGAVVMATCARALSKYIRKYK
jgi:hypothetical protein